MAIKEIHEDILQTHILTRLDGQTLAAIASTSSQLQSLCTHEKLWSDICNATWPSAGDPAVRRLNSDHRSFFSDAFPAPSGHLSGNPPPPPQTTHVISAVDLRYLNDVVFSKVETTNTTPNDWFETTPFRIDLLEPKELVPSTVKFSGDDLVVKTSIEKHMSLSWILIDPVQNRAVNLSSIKPVSVQRNWLTCDLDVTFAVVVVVGGEHVSCTIEVTCGVREGGGELAVSGVSLTVQDMDGKCLTGKGSMEILQGLTAEPRRRRSSRGGGEEERERYEVFIEKKRERKEEKERIERRLDMVCVACGVALLGAFWSFALC